MPVMDIIGIDLGQVERAARILRRHKASVERLDVFDEKYYPPRGDNVENVLRFFLVTVALDHRLSRPGRPYEACIPGDGCYHGADLLYRLAKLKYEEDRGFYDPIHLSRITVEEVRDWLTVGNATPPDPEIRALLLRDLGYKLLKLYDGRVSRLLEESHGRIHGSLGEPGLADNLRVFRAYEDPVEKKTMLLAKFLLARGLFKPTDNLDVAVDNHLSRIAYRLGIVVVSGRLWDKIRRGEEVSREEDVMLRLTIRRAYRMLAEKAGLDPLVLDDHLWLMGRKTCLRDTEPRCDECIFRKICLAVKRKAFLVSEHTHYNTWYY
jgi:hypothetical protein